MLRSNQTEVSRRRFVQNVETPVIMFLGPVGEGVEARFGWVIEAADRVRLQQEII
jgi:hypothetical protein